MTEALTCNDCNETVIEIGTSDGFVYTCDCQGRVVPVDEVDTPVGAEDAWDAADSNGGDSTQ